MGQASLIVDKDERYGVIVYQSTSAAYASEKALQNAGLVVKIIPVPRSLSTDCCLGLRISWERKEQAQDILWRAGIEFVAIFPWPPE